MTTYLATWLSVLFLGGIAQTRDYRIKEALTADKASHTKAAKIFYWLGAAVLIFVAGCRYYIGSDYYAYYGWYESYATSLQERIRTLDEPGISLIYAIIVKIWDDGFACVFAADAIMIFLVLRTLFRHTERIAFALILYALICWTATFNGMRQTLAISVLFSGLPFIKKRKLIPFLIVSFLAYLCHKSSLIFVMLYFVAYREINVKNLILLTVGAIVLLRSYELLFELTGAVLDKDFTNLNAYSTRQVNVLRIAANIAPAIYFCIRNWNREKDRETTLCLNLLVLSAVISLVTSDSAYLARAGMFMAPFKVLALCELTKREGRNQQFLMVGIVILFMIFEGYEVLNSPDLTPFRWIWSR